jgi:hypothetical protein
MGANGIALDKRHFTVIELLKKENLCASRLAARMGIRYGSALNIIDAITYHDPNLVEDDDGLLSYVDIKGVYQ